MVDASVTIAELIEIVIENIEYIEDDVNGISFNEYKTNIIFELKELLLKIKDSIS